MELIKSLSLKTISFPTLELDEKLSASMTGGSVVGVGAVPPSWMEEIGMECKMQCILLGPLVLRTLSS